MDALLRDGKLRDYAIAVHGIKGASYGICASDIAHAAEKLEQAALEGETEAVKAGHPELKRMTVDLLSEINTMLAKIDADKPEASRPDPELLAELCRACERYDTDGVDAAMGKLEAFRYTRDGELVKRLRELADNMDFEGIIKVIYGKE
jgi:HPt (histidine-containing phosphotransfer) domain-containing protein